MLSDFILLFCAARSLFAIRNAKPNVPFFRLKCEIVCVFKPEAYEMVALSLKSFVSTFVRMNFNLLLC